MTNRKTNCKTNTEFEKAILKINFNELIYMERKDEDYYSKAKHFFLEEYK